MFLVFLLADKEANHISSAKQGDNEMYPCMLAEVQTKWWILTLRKTCRKVCCYISILYLVYSHLPCATFSCNFTSLAINKPCLRS